MNHTILLVVYKMEVPTEGPDQGPLLPRNPRQAPDETRSSLEVASEEVI